MNVFGWTVVGSAAGIVGALAAVVALFRRQRAAPELENRNVASADATVGASRPVQPGKALLPAPVLDTQVRGRDDLIATLASLAVFGDNRVHVVAGLGGTGKSTVARAVAARLATENRRVWWVPAADAVLLTQLLLGLARELGATPDQVQEALTGRLNPSDVLWQQLVASPGWTLILDNADDLPTLAASGRDAASGSGWLRPSPAGLILVTSRVSDPHQWGPPAHVHRLQPLDEQNGSQVLRDLAPSGGDEPTARSLSARLGGLPLALHHAGSYLASPFAAETTFAAYERALSARFEELMSRGHDDRAKVTATWELSLASLRAQGKQQAEPLIRVLSCFASSVAIPTPLLDHQAMAAICGTVTAVEDGLSALLSVGLIDTAEPAGGGPPDVMVHPLVAQTIQHRAGDDLRTSLQQAVQLLATAVSHLDHEDPATGALWVAFQPHLQALQQAQVQMTAEAEASLADTAVRVSVGLLWGGRYVAALTVAEVGLAREHHLPNEHPRVLSLRERRASAQEFLGQYTQAEAEYRQVLNTRLQVLGPDHPAILTNRHHLAMVLAKQGKTTEAETEHRQVLDARLRSLGPDHPSTLATRHEIATVLGEQGKTAEAEAEHRQVLDARLRSLGPDHPSTLATRHNLALVLARQGKTAEAEAEHRQVLDAKRRVLGPDHPDTLISRHNLAFVLARQGKTAEAEAEYRQVLDARLRSLGPDHPSTLATRHNLALVLARQGKTAEAEAEHRQVLDAKRRVLGPDHPSTRTTQRSLQDLYGDRLGRAD